MADRLPGRLVLIGLGALALGMGIWTGLVRLGFASEGTVAATGLPLEHHATLMVSGFLGTLIGIERAAACGRGWAWAAPALSGLGAVGLLLGVSDPAAHGLMVAAALVLTGVMILLWRRQPGMAAAVMAIAPLGWVAGNLTLLAGRPPRDSALWWAAFLILTIAGERLVLSRLTRTPPAARIALGVGCGLAMTGALVTMAVPAKGTAVAGAGWLLLAAWLLWFDVARKRIRIPGLPRFVATGLMVGYTWLGVAATLLLTQGLDPFARSLRIPLGGAASATAFPYDATLHALFLGFVFSMIFAHAPIVLPAVFGRELSWRRRFWIHVALLHGSLALRVGADLTGATVARTWSGLGNALAIAVFGVSTAAAVLARPAADVRRAGRHSGSGPEPASSPRRPGPAVGEAGAATGPAPPAARG